MENIPDDILNNPIIKQLMAGGSTALNLAQRKQALDILKDYLSNGTDAKKTPSIGESENPVITEDSDIETDTLLERIAELEHEQWEEWSKNIAETETISEDRLTRWKTMWIPYSELTEEQKDQDREYAKKVLKELGKN